MKETVSQEWVPRHVRTEGNTGEDCCDLFEKGITGEKYLDWLRAHMVEGPPTIHVKPHKSEESSDEGNQDKGENNPPGWPDLIPLESPTLPRMRSTLLPGFAGKFVRALSAATETSPELAFAMVLGAVATAAARRFVVQVMPGYIEPPNIWILAAQPSGTRKSVVQSATTKPLVVWEFEQAKAVAPEIKKISSERKTSEARIKKLRTKAASAESQKEADTFAAEASTLEADLQDIPSEPQLWTSDVTPERLGSLLADNDECMSWHSSEAGLFDTIGGRYSNGLPNLDLILKAHSGDPERVDRGSRPPVYLRQPLLTIGLSPQPEVLRGLASKPGFRGRGLLGRFLYLMPQTNLGYRTLDTIPISPAIQKAYADGITAMLNWEPATDEGGTL
jgi:hypothetical protein